METTSLPFLLLKYIGAGRLIVSTEAGIVIRHRPRSPRQIQKAHAQASALGQKQAQYQKSQRRERQLQIGVQEARKRRPELSDDALLELGKVVHEKRCEAFGLGS